MGYLFLPVILEEVYLDIGVETTVGKYQYILDVLTYLKESDSQIKMFFNQKEEVKDIAKKLFQYIEIDSFDEIKEDSLKQFNDLIIDVVNNIRLIKEIYVHTKKQNRISHYCVILQIISSTIPFSALSEAAA